MARRRRTKKAAPKPQPEIAKDPFVELQGKLGCSFLRPDLLRLALTHASSKAESKLDNERMEFLGDAVLGLVVCSHLYLSRPEATEGQMTEVKSALVSAKTLTECGRRLKLEKYLILGKGVTDRKGALPASLYANAVEALIAAVYLDGGIGVARNFILGMLAGKLDAPVAPAVPAVAPVPAPAPAKGNNYKSLLQEICQGQMGLTPAYRIVSESGPDHGKTFKVVAVVDERSFPPGSGRSKKAAEQEAARLAIEQIQSE